MQQDHSEYHDESSRIEIYCESVELNRALFSNWANVCCQLMTSLNDVLYCY